MFSKWVEQDGRFAFDDADNDGVEISGEDYEALLMAQESGMEIVKGVGGLPVAAPSAE